MVTRSVRSAGSDPSPSGSPARSLGDAILKLVITKGVDVANVTHLGRSATIAQQVALGGNNPSAPCWAARAPAGSRTTTATNGSNQRTRLDELDPLCKHHHDLKTYDNWALIEGTGPRLRSPVWRPRTCSTSR